MDDIHECEVHRLRPTQITVGMIEVADKRKRLDTMSHHERKEFLEARPIPAVLGAGDLLYITDHHHLARAIVDAGYDTGFFRIEARLDTLAPDAFWHAMHERSWVHAVDAQGLRRPVSDIPRHVGELVDDPYRSLAGYVREAGGYAKTAAAFAEFLWADFFRKRLAIGATRGEFDAAVEEACALAHTPEARDLPGYIAGKPR